MKTEEPLNIRAACHALHFPENAMGVVICDGITADDPDCGVPMIWNGEIDRIDHDDKPECYGFTHPITGEERWVDAMNGQLWISDGLPHGIVMFAAKCWQEWLRSQE